MSSSRSIDPMDLVRRARDGGYAVGGFNMHNPETTQALLLAAERADAPVFMQIGRAVIPHMGIDDAYEMTKKELDRSDAVAVIHLDHGTLDEVHRAFELGFDSIMFDGSHLPFQQNVEATRDVVKEAHELGIPVEAELGSIPDAAEDIRWEDHYTKVEEAEAFVKETGVDLLAISAGVMHGVTASAPLPLAIDRIRQIRDVVGVPLVLHGASGVPTDDVRQAILAGVHKLNADTDLRHAFRAGIERMWAQGDRQLEAAMAEGRRLMIDATIGKMREFGCDGKAAGAAAEQQAVSS